MQTNNSSNMKVHILTIFEVIEGETIIPSLMRIVPFYDLAVAQAELKKEYDSCKESFLEGPDPEEEWDEEDVIVEDQYTTSPTGEDKWILTSDTGLTYTAEISTMTVE